MKLQTSTTPTLVSKNITPSPILYHIREGITIENVKTKEFYE